ncbi:5-formyltetrahydrofolate cyclo-ligase [Massilia sp. CF038]|uniref:5-formyltetrahydrofolate cyclo-ligase n=1 Tax=Massilia sp. CF038 TaxID=1881045 RepID=UPI000922870D|nr:5-formyltetrahydrofolate cyclo-ligase [Massilia sp. CF038]SHH39454.1 5-formyltetrahydrofolate cyclo-ligase [Massilia sp. CF038]
MVDTTMEKAALRKALLAARAALTPMQKAAFDAAICARVLAWWEANLAGSNAVLGVYWPLRGEPDLAPAYAALSARGAALALPVVLERDAALGFAAWTPGEALLRDAMGVAVPAALRMVARPPALLIPCLGFNAGRFRLGYGGGYYDRTLAPLPRPLTVGVAYTCLAADFASAAHDVALDLIITEA